MRPLEARSWSFTDSKPRMKIKYDAKHTHVWTIGEFSKKMQMENGRRLESDTFSIKVGDKIIDWCLKIHPNGDTDASAGHISIYLIKASVTKASVKVNSTISVVDWKGVKSNSKTADWNKSLGWSKYISHSDLKNLIPYDSLTIMCELTIKGGGESLVGSGATGILAPGGNEGR